MRNEPTSGSVGYVTIEADHDKANIGIFVNSPAGAYMYTELSAEKVYDLINLLASSIGEPQPFPKVEA